jgi:hypothetical protein
MRYDHKSPIFCDNCPGFAMAELEGVVLCTGCLMRALLSSEDPRVFEKVRPLDSIGTPLRPSEAPPPSSEAPLP